jgi:hypothetical protein
MFEHRSQALAPLPVYVRRQTVSVGIGLILILISLAIGMCGYHFLDGLSWIDSFLNASMIISTMGPVSPVRTPAAKIFAGCFALYSGFSLILVAGIIFAPAVHRVLHRFHLESQSETGAADSERP